MSTFSIICWSFTTITMSYNLFVWGNPFPRSKKKKERLRALALEKMEQSSEDDFQKSFEENRIRDEKNYEKLFLYSRFADRYRTIDLKSLVTTLRFYRISMRSFLRTSMITDKHLECYMKFDPFLSDGDLNAGPNGNKNHKALEHTMIYALNHLNEADGILKVVSERGVHDLKQVKSLMNEIKEAPAPTLSEGML